jgi:hypothetical protein
MAKKTKFNMKLILGLVFLILIVISIGYYLEWWGKSEKFTESPPIKFSDPSPHFRTMMNDITKELKDEPNATLQNKFDELKISKIESLFENKIQLDSITKLKELWIKETKNQNFRVICNGFSEDMKKDYNVSNITTDSDFINLFNKNVNKPVKERDAQFGPFNCYYNLFFKRLKESYDGRLCPENAPPNTHTIAKEFYSGVLTTTSSSTRNVSNEKVYTEYTSNKHKSRELYIQTIKKNFSVDRINSERIEQAYFNDPHNAFPSSDESTTQGIYPEGHPNNILRVLFFGNMDDTVRRGSHEYWFKLLSIKRIYILDYFYLLVISKDRPGCGNPKQFFDSLSNDDIQQIFGMMILWWYSSWSLPFIEFGFVLKTENTKDQSKKYYLENINNSYDKDNIYYRMFINKITN